MFGLETREAHVSFVQLIIPHHPYASNPMEVLTVMLGFVATHWEQINTNFVFVSLNDMIVNYIRYNVCVCSMWRGRVTG